MKQRVFIGIPISKTLQKKILDWEKRYQRLPVRWTAGHNLHITLVPPWYVEDTNRVKGQLKAADYKVKPFKIAFHRVKYGPEEQRPRLIWAEGPRVKEVLQLKDILEQLLGKEPEKREFLLHLTIARFRAERFSEFPIKHLEEKVHWEEKIKSLVLFESKLSPSGAEYRKLLEVPFFP